MARYQEVFMTQDYSVSALLAGKAKEGDSVSVRGWVKTRRDSKAGLSFIHVSDGSHITPMQVVAPNSLENYERDVQRLSAGCAIVASGRLVKSQGKGQTFEIEAADIDVIGWVDSPETYPIQAKRHTMEFLRDVAHLRMRTNTIAAVTRMRHRLTQAIHRFLDDRGFYWVNTPIITSSDCEGAGELLRVSTLDLQNLPKTLDGKVDFNQDFFGKEAFLTVSGQLNVESYCMGMSKVYTFGPTFRAENSHTSRHLAEFWMVEPEIAFANLEDVCQLSQEMLQSVIKDILEKCPDDLNFFNRFIDKTCLQRLEKLANAPFEVIDYSDAIKRLEQSSKKFEFPVQWGLDLQSEHERYLSEDVFKCPVVVTNYPKDIKSFYMRLNDDGKTVAAMDVLVPGMGELIGGSQREERLDILDARMDACGIDKEQYAWYRDLRRYGSVPHAGFGMGFERLISYVTGLSNVRDVIPFPRTAGHAAY